LKNIYLRFFAAFILHISFPGNACGANNINSRECKIFMDTTARGHVKIHHFIELGVTAQLGKQFVRTYNNYERTTDNYNNNIVQQNARFFSILLGHELRIKNTIAAGITYGTDVAIEPHDVRAFIPLMLHVSKYVVVAKKLALFFSQRLGYSFYIRSNADNPFIQYTGVEGGFTSETIAGLSVPVGHKVAFELLPGYRLQHINSKMIFTPGTALTQTPGFSNLPGRIKEVSNGFYNLLYFTIGISF